MNTPELKAALRAFAAQRPGFEHGNYNTLSAYRADQKRTMRDKADALVLISAYPDDADPRFLVGVLSSGNRLSLEGGQLEYTAGQYYCTQSTARLFAAPFPMPCALFRGPRVKNAWPRPASAWRGSWAEAVPIVGFPNRAFRR